MKILKPLFDKVVVKEVEEKNTTDSGIILLNSNKEKPQIAEVVSVGNGGIVDGEKIEMIVKKGDKIIYSKYAGSEFKFDDITYTVIRQSDILAIIEEKE